MAKTHEPIRAITHADGVKCPYCGNVHTDDLGEYVTYWGDEKGTFSCEQCDQDFEIEEHVQRSWTSTPIVQRGATVLLLLALLCSSASAGWYGHYYPRPTAQRHLYSTPVRIHHTPTQRHFRGGFRGLSWRMHRHYAKRAPNKYRRLYLMSEFARASR